VAECCRDFSRWKFRDVTQIDVTTFLGAYPFRDVGAPNPAALAQEMERVGTTAAWVSHLDAVYRRNPDGGNAAVYAAAELDPRLRAVPAIHPSLPGWIAALEEAVARGVPAVRCDPTLYGLPPVDDGMRELLAACATRALPVMMAVRLEDLRQRQPEDIAVDLPAWAVRRLIRSHPAIRLVITHADRDFIEQVHFGSTPQEAARILWDISWVWGPPEDHLELLLRTVGIARFTFGTGMPLRLPETSLARLDLLDLNAGSRQQIIAGNLSSFCQP
jgi:predicted TIM-barrel fold metal-dependent hydrolase